MKWSHFGPKGALFPNQYLQMGIFLSCLVIFCSTSQAEEKKKEGPSGKDILNAIQSTVATVSSNLEKSLVPIRIDGGEKVETGGRRSWRRGSYGGNRKYFTGIVLSADGYIVIPMEIDPEKLERITLWLNEEETTAKFLATHDKLRMSIIQVKTEEKLTPINIDKGNDAKIGECLVSVQPSGEENDFESYTTFSFNRGERTVGRYRQFLTSFRDEGSAIVNLDGEIIGIVKDRQVLAIRDLRRDINKLIKKAQKSENPDKAKDDEKEKDPWLGAMLWAINEDYAKNAKLPKGTIWITAVMSGTPADKAGLKAQDLAIEVNGRPVKKTSRNALAHFHKILDPEIGEPFTIKVIRDGKPVDIKGTFAAKPDPDELKADDIGIEVAKFNDADFYMNNLSVKKGVLVKGIRAGSPAAVSPTFGASMIHRNDVIIRFDDKPITSIEDFKSALDEFRKKKADIVLLKVYRGSTIVTAALNLKIGEEKARGK